MQTTPVRYFNNYYNLQILSNETGKVTVYVGLYPLHVCPDPASLEKEVGKQPLSKHWKATIRQQLLPDSEILVRFGNMKMWVIEN